MIRRLLAILVTASLLLAFVATAIGRENDDAKAEKKPAAAGQRDVNQSEGPKYIRLRRGDDKQPLAMETAVIHFASSEDRPGIQVDLVGAVHVGDKAYYDELNKLFESYDVVLYELVAPEGTRVPKEGRKGPSGHPVGALQDGMSSILALQHQLDSIDYTKENFVHADLSPEEFAKTMEKRGESFMQMFLRLMGQGMAQQANAGGSGGDLGLLMALFSKDRALALKIAMAEQFENLEGQMAVFDGPEGSTIITERNKRAFEVLKKELDAGKKKIAVFYGAGHLPDMERRLTDEFKLKRTGEKWLVAWSLEKAKAKKTEEKKAEEAPQPELKIELPK